MEFQYKITRNQLLLIQRLNQEKAYINAKLKRCKYGSKLWNEYQAEYEKVALNVINLEAEIMGIDLDQPIDL